jgi:hypothetical protein
MQAAEVVQLHAPETSERVLPVVHTNGVIVGDPRALAVAKFRELADKLERGEVDAARVEWAFNLPNLTTVIRDSEGTCVRLNVDKIVAKIEEG